jgi:hypothetical protein
VISHTITCARSSLGAWLKLHPDPEYPDVNSFHGSA